MRFSPDNKSEAVPMKKKILSLLLITIMLMALVPQTALASASVTTDKTSAYPGDTVLISGTAGADESVVIKITDEAGNIVFFDAAKADASGIYSAAFIVPTDMTAGKLTVTAGSGSDVATTKITVKAAAQPTATSTSTASPTGTATPTAGTSSTASPSASEDEPSPTPSAPGAEEGRSLIPKEISQDEETGIITIVIDVDDLPEGTVAIQTPDGKILYVSDAEHGLLVIEVTEDDVDVNGDIEIVALDDEMTPLAALRIQVLDENEEIIKTGEEGGSIWIIIVCVAAGGLLVLGAVLWILLKRRNRAAGDDTGAGI